MGSKSPLQGCAVLVVEDEMMIGLWLEQVLKDFGCSVSLAGTVDQALKLILVNEFDAATLDINLTVGDSLPVADALAALGVPFAFMTGYSSHKLGRHRDQVVLTKPVREFELVATLSQLLANRGSPCVSPEGTQTAETSTTWDLSGRRTR
jgi:DNA-binding response OmpR family regulator